MLLKYSKTRKKPSKTFIKILFQYKYYLYILANRLITRQLEFRNILKIKFTKSNIFPSIFVRNVKNDEQHELLFTISLGTFRKLTKYLG